MLVYIACDAREEVLCPITDEMIPFSLTSRFCEERTFEEKERLAKDHAHEFATINLLFEEDFHGFEVRSFEDLLLLLLMDVYISCGH